MYLQKSDAIAVLMALREAQEASRVAYKNNASNKNIAWQVKCEAERDADKFISDYQCGLLD